MKLGNPLRRLLENVEKMEGEEITFTLGVAEEAGIYVDIEALRSGIEISLENLDDPATSGGLLSIQGHQVLLYIQDQGSRFDSVMKSPVDGRRFHIADCRTLERMRINQRFHERYVATNDISGEFAISGFSNNVKAKGRAKLNVCKNCLKRINYKGYQLGSASGREIFNDFELSEFFSNYSSVFRQMPSKYNDEVLGELISLSKNQKIEHIQKCKSSCEKCKVKLQGKSRLFDVVKLERGKDPVLLCLDCLRKTPHSVHIHVPRSVTEEINSLRQKQQLVVNDWLGATLFADPACFGLLEAYKQLDWSLPLIGYDIRDADDVVQTTVELAWPELSPPQAVYLNEESGTKARNLGWQVFSLDEALREVRQDGSY